MPGKATVLIVDDDKNTRDGLSLALNRHYRVLTAESGEKALACLAADPDVDILLSDMRMPGMGGLELLKAVRSKHPAVTCILLTAYGTIDTAVDAMRHGAYNFLMKPVSLDQLDLMLDKALKDRALEQRVQSLESQLEERFGLENIVGRSEAMRPVFETIQQVAPTQATVLIQGPSGTGKELVARAIHRLSPRADKPFVAINCAALPASLLESELFGHEKGAFTGALAQRIGRFEQADQGTLFLDEISEIDASVQVKLLRVLESRQFERLGGTQTVDVNIRVIAATNRNLRAYVDQGKFREDLFFRLDVVDILLPPLRERAGDIELLANRFLHEFNKVNGRAIEGFTPEAMRLLNAYAWPGNVRELRNTVERMVVLAKGTRLDVSDIPQTLRENTSAAPAATTAATVAAGGSLAETEKRQIMDVLQKNKGNRTKTAIELGISRRTLHRKLKEWREESEEASAREESK
ncbi:MAG: sigma-54-dependent Fis family transcriptional regulator [Kiritimatiellae bacterium]|nr:sigma-54-dependent Fis family transcriptional regulator [Kiritimatiellia bacterium]